MYNKPLLFRAACAGMLFFGISLLTLGSIASSLQQKYGLTDVATGTLFSILPVGVLLGSLLFGPISDKFGYKPVLSLSCFLICIGFEGMAHASSINIIKLCILLFGAGGGAINGATNALVSDISTKHKGADLSLLGVFFGLGALGVPFMLGLLEKQLSFETILSIIGIAALVLGVLYAATTFPLPKQHQQTTSISIPSLLSHKFLLLIAFFLFCQSSFEAIINNWTTTYLTSREHIRQSEALYALSLFVAGMAGMRLLLGSVLRTIKSAAIWTLLFVMIGIGLLLLKWGYSFALSAAGLVLLGGGLSGGFPLMLGYAGNYFKQASATAFSIALTIALLGNMIINYCMGVVAQRYGIGHLITVAAIETVVMISLCSIILKQINNTKN